MLWPDGGTLAVISEWPCISHKRNIWFDAKELAGKVDVCVNAAEMFKLLILGHGTSLNLHHDPAIYPNSACMTRIIFKNIHGLVAGVRV